MSMREQIPILESLSALDSQIFRVNEQLERYRSHSTEELTALDARIKKDQETLASLEQQRDAVASHKTEDLAQLNAAVEAARLAIDTALAERSAAVQAVDLPTMSVEALEAERKQLHGERSQWVAKLPAALYRRYESIRVRRPVAIAKTHDGTCLGCHLSVPPLMFQKMRRQEEFETCPNCRRILYYVAVESSMGVA